MRSLREETKFHQMWRGAVHGRAADEHKARWLMARTALGIGRGAATSEPPGSMLIAADIDRAFDHIDGPLLMLGIERQRRSPARRRASTRTGSHDVDDRTIAAP